MKRIFAAIKIHPNHDFILFFNELKKILGFEAIRWVDENNFHLTLKFFGETDEKTIPVIGKILENSTGMMTSFNLHLTELGLFGSAYAPRVIYCGLEPKDRLLLLMKNLHHDLEIAGFESDRQNLVPHLTLGRIKALKDKQFFQKMLVRYHKVPFTEEKVNDIILYESILRHEGPQYFVIHTFHFKKELP